MRPPGPTNLTLSSSQATEHGVKLTVAMRMTGSTCALSTLYGRVDRFRRRKAEEELADMASYEIKKGRRLFEPIIAGIHRERAEYALESEAELDASSPAIGSLSDLTASLASSLSASSSSATKNPSSLDQRIESGLANFPSWMKSDVARHDMTRRPRKNLPQAHLSRLTKKRDKTYYEDRYKAAFKVATLAAKVSKAEKGKRGNGVDSICQRVNDEMLTSPADRKLRPSTLHRAVQRGEFGISPLKLGRKSSLPKEFTQALAVHSVMMQVSGEGEMSSIKMRTLATAMTLGTPHEGKLTDAHIWKTTRHRHPEYIKPAQAVDNEDRRVDWLTYGNIILWMKMAKKFLLAVEMAKDEPGLIRKWGYLLVFFLCPRSSRVGGMMQRRNDAPSRSSRRRRRIRPGPLLLRYYYTRSNISMFVFVLQMQMVLRAK